MAAAASDLVKVETNGVMVDPLTPVEEPEVTKEANKLRSPKRQSSTVYEKVCAKLTRSGIKASLSSPSLKKAPLATEDLDLDIEDDAQVVQLRANRHHAQRRCHSEVTPSKTAELLAQFVASRANPAPAKEPEKKVEDLKKHTPLPKAMEDTTQPIMYIDKTTGFLQVDMMWTCTKCSFAYNKVETTKCEVCNVQRALPKDKEDSQRPPAKAEESPPPSSGDIQLVNSQVIKVKNKNKIFQNKEGTFLQFLSCLVLKKGKMHNFRF